MNVMTRLTRVQLSRNKKRTRITLIAIVLSVAMIVTVAGFIVSIQDAFRQTVIDTYGDFHVCYINVTPEQAKRIAEDSEVGTSYTKNEDGQLTVYFRLLHPTKDYDKTAEEIAARNQLPMSDATQPIAEAAPGSLIDVGYNKDLLAAEGVIANNDILRALLGFGGAFILIIAAASILVISNSFSISADDRTRQFGVLKSVGGTRNQILHSVLLEGGLLSLIGIPIGIVVGLLMEWAALGISVKLLPETMRLKMIVSPAALCVSAVLSVATILLSAYFPAKKAAKTSPLDAIRMTDAIRISPKEVKTSRWGQKAFGIEGTLASKTFKRNRSKYRATILALTLAVLLFIGVSSFGEFMTQTAQMAYPEYGSDLMINLNQIRDSQRQEIAKRLAEIPESSISTVKTLSLSAENPGDLLSDAYKKAFPDKTLWNQPVVMLSIFALDEPRFASLCKQGSVNPSSMTDGSPLQGILINRLRGTSIDIAPYRFEPNMTLQVSGPNGGYPISLAASVEQIPDDIVLLMRQSAMVILNVVVPEKTFRAMVDEGNPPATYVMVQTEDSKAFAAQAEKILVEDFSLQKGNYSITDYAEMAAMNRNITLLVSIFVYGFIFLLSLIAITSVVNTISTSIELRKQEFSMLMSVGMTTEGLNRMLLFESLQYAIKTLCYGIPIGLGISYVLYAALHQQFEFPYVLPWQSLLIGILAILLISLGMVSYSKRKLKGLNIVETLRMQSV
jgi:putative ABC transport system permease protein